MKLINLVLAADAIILSSNSAQAITINPTLGHNGVMGWTAPAGIVDWQWAAIMMVGATIGGYFGAVIARRLTKQIVRGLIIFIGLSMSAAFYIL